jgi:hypothetical protein
MCFDYRYAVLLLQNTGYSYMYITIYVYSFVRFRIHAVFFRRDFSHLSATFH